MNPRCLMHSMLLLAAGATPAVAGSIVIDATPFADANSTMVALEVTITDNGELLPDCATFGIRRRAIYPCGPWEDVACIARENGTRTLYFVDDEVERNTTYQYEAIGYATSEAPCTVPFADGFAFQDAFFYSGFPFPILAFVSVGPDPTPVAQGQLVSQDDAAANVAFRSQCSNSCLQLFGAGGWGLPGVAAYFDTGIDVLVYGIIQYNGNSAGYTLGATAAEPRQCPPIAIGAKTWTDVKRLYR